MSDDRAGGTEEDVCGESVTPVDENTFVSCEVGTLVMTTATKEVPRDDIGNLYGRGVEKPIKNKTVRPARSRRITRRLVDTTRAIIL